MHVVLIIGRINLIKDIPLDKYMAATQTLVDATPHQEKKISVGLSIQNNNVILYCLPYHHPSTPLSPERRTFL